MGQQQLLLVILVTIIVGIATVVAINTFSSAADSANLDAVRQDVASIAASAQGFYMKPEMMGGGGQDFTDITFDDLSFAATDISSDGLTAFNQNGVYVISSGSSSSFTITAHPASEIDGAPALDATASNTMVADIEQDNIDWTRSSPGTS
jgi:Tfp pilus assembly protein PilE